jgi:hypothetical protein
MAVITPNRVDENKATGTIIWKWEAMGGADTGLPVFMAKHPDMTVLIEPVTHGGATTTFEWTIDERGDPENASHADAVWIALTDTTETAISTTTADFGAQALQGAMWVRPKTAGGTSSNINAWLKGTIRG